MNCPRHGCDGKTKVYETREAERGNPLRRRRCLSCGFRFRTEERLITSSINGPARQVTLVQSVTRDELARLMDECEDIGELADRLGVAWRVVCRWLAELDL